MVDIALPRLRVKPMRIGFIACRKRGSGGHFGDSRNLMC
jgi:hypothetical protein